MVDFVSWAGVVVIAIFSIVGFTGVVVTSVLTVVRALRRPALTDRIEVRQQIAA